MEDPVNNNTLSASDMRPLLLIRGARLFFPLMSLVRFSNGNNPVSTINYSPPAPLLFPRGARLPTPPPLRTAGVLRGGGGGVEREGGRG